MRVKGWIERTSRGLGIALAALSLAASAAAARPADGPCQVEKRLSVPAQMRDGTVLYADVKRPRAARS
jgi:predicted acyl esterase